MRAHTFMLSSSCSSSFAAYGIVIRLTFPPFLHAQQAAVLAHVHRVRVAGQHQPLQ